MDYNTKFIITEVVLLVAVVILCIACVFIMKKLQPECVRLYVGYLIFLWILEGIFLYFLNGQVLAQ